MVAPECLSGRDFTPQAIPAQGGGWSKNPKKFFAAAKQVAVACGAAGEFLEPAADAGCDVLVIGETMFHTCLEAEALDIALLLPGHFASERFAVETLAECLASEFPDLSVWASREEKDPLHWV
jgi:putative NIF3 family GTP cyclohydrolase 1 type 2